MTIVIIVGNLHIVMQNMNTALFWCVCVCVCVCVGTERYLAIFSSNFCLSHQVCVSFFSDYMQRLYGVLLV